MASGGRAVQVALDSRNSLSYLRASVVLPDQSETRDTVRLFMARYVYTYTIWRDTPPGVIDLVVTIAHAFQTVMPGGPRHDVLDLDGRHPETLPFESALLVKMRRGNLLVKKLDESPAPPP